MVLFSPLDTCLDVLMWRTRPKCAKLLDSFTSVSLDHIEKKMLTLDCIRSWQFDRQNLMQENEALNYLLIHSIFTQFGLICFNVVMLCGVLDYCWHIVLRIEWRI